MNYYKCFNRVLELELDRINVEKLDFWLNRFCPNIKKIDKVDNIDIILRYESTDKNDYVIKNNKIILSGESNNCESFLAKFITQVFQKLLIKDNIIIVPAACVANDYSCVLIIGDFWQGKTTVATSFAKEYELKLVSDNYVAIKNNKVVGATKYISIREEQEKGNSNHLLKINNRLFYDKSDNFNVDYNISLLLVPHINGLNNDIHYISKEESIWYLYQKFTRLLCGETVLFDGKSPSPIFLNKSISKKILRIVTELLVNIKLKYVSASIENINKAILDDFNKQED